MFISVLELFKIGIGPSSSHTTGPMLAAGRFLEEIRGVLPRLKDAKPLRLRCILKGSLAFTGRGHGTDKAVLLGVHGFRPEAAAKEDEDRLVRDLTEKKRIELNGCTVQFMTLDSCIAAMKQTGLEMSHKFRETSLGGLAVNWIEC